MAPTITYIMRLELLANSYIIDWYKLCMGSEVPINRGTYFYEQWYGLLEWWNRITGMDLLEWTTGVNYCKIVWKNILVEFCFEIFVYLKE